MNRVKTGCDGIRLVWQKCDRVGWNWAQQVVQGRGWGEVMGRVVIFRLVGIGEIYIKSLRYSKIHFGCYEVWCRIG